VLLADLSLNQPDFRAGERTFQTLTQVAGRAGRGQAPGRVLIQTFHPGHYAVRLAQSQDFESFYQAEIKARERLRYPPFSRLANFRVAGLDPALVRETARDLGGLARRKALAKNFHGRVSVLGPAPAPIARVRGKTRWMMMVKADTPPLMSAFSETVFSALAKRDHDRGVKIEIDRDPASLM
jgi:primosomal protein N' (replication factor Y)